ncbi:MAG: lysylphosphatidylglycerol synthase transmembrane domain-containing protein [Bacteroidota bacterium]
MNKQLINVLKFIVFVGTGFGIFYLVYQKQNAAFIEECALNGIAAADCSLVDKVVTDFTSANFFWILMALLAFTISNISRSIRWKMLIEPLGYTPRLINCFFSTILMYFANLGFPRLGEVVRPGTLSRYEKIPVDQLLGTSVMDRIMDVVSILIVTGLTLLLEYQNIVNYLGQHINVEEKLASLWQPGVIGTVAAVGLALLAIIYFLRQRLLRTKLVQKGIEVVKGIFNGLKTIGQLEKPGLFILHSINIWVMYYLMTYLLFFSFAPTAALPATAALLVFVMGGWGIVIPSPGGMGTYHFLAGVALSIYAVGGDDAFSFANISFFSIQIGSNLVLGIVALLALPILNKDYRPAPPQQRPDEKMDAVPAA